MPVLQSEGVRACHDLAFAEVKELKERKGVINKWHPDSLRKYLLKK